MSESGIGGSVCYESRESYSISRRWHDLWKNNTHIDHEYQISIVLTLFFDDLSQNIRWDHADEAVPLPVYLYQ